MGLVYVPEILPSGSVPNVILFAFKAVRLDPTPLNTLERFVNARLPVYVPESLPSGTVPVVS